MTILKSVSFYARQAAGGSISGSTRFAVSLAVVAGLLAIFALSGSLPTRTVTAAEPTPMFSGRSALVEMRRRGTYDSLIRTLKTDKARKDYKIPADLNAPEAFGGSTKIQAGDGLAGDQFGGSVAIAGDTVIIGANANSATAGGPGSAYVYVRSGGAWTMQQKLTALDGAPDDAFGSYVAISGDTAVVGAYADTVGSNVNQGSAYVFVRSGTSWTQQQKLTAVDGASGDIFGRSVAIAGDTIAVGSSSSDNMTNFDQGAAYVYFRTGTTWSQQAKLLSTDGASGDYFGDSVSISGETVIVGATEDSTGTSLQHGSAYAFTRTGTAWTQQAKLAAADGTVFDYFGFAVAIAGDTVVIGSLQDVGANFQQGAGYVFTRSGTTWTQQQKLLAGDGAINDSFGSSVAVLGDTVMIGSPFDTNGAVARQGSAYTFTRTGTTWTQSQKLLASDGAAEDLFGAGVAFSQSTAIVGSVGDTIGANPLQGSAYIFTSDVTIGGRVTTPSGLNLRNALVTLIDSAGDRRTTQTSSFGIYSFANVRTGETYTITAGSKRYRFSPQILLVNTALTNVDFVGLE